MLKFRVLSLLLIALILGCSQNQTERSRVDRAIRQMNNRQYSEAVSILETVYAENPSDSSTALLLAQAHLGNANFEMMGLVGKISNRQEPVPSDKYWVEQPTCDDGPIEKLAGYDARCLLFRLMNNLPDAEHPSLIRARKILRTAFKDPSRTPSDVNFLSALVEFSSAFYRLRELGKSEAKTLLQAEPNDVGTANAQFKLVSYNLKRFLLETQFGFKRLRYSYGKLSSFVKSLDGKPMVRIGDRSLIFSDSMDTGDILRFASLIMSDRAQAMDWQINDYVEQNIRVVGIKYSSTLARLDRSFFSRDQLENLSLYWKFDRVLSQIVEAFAENDGRDFKFKPALLLWEKPPIIFREFRSAIEQSWAQEKVDPVWNYFIQTKDQWNTLGLIMDDWGYWFDNTLSTQQRDSIKEYLKHMVRHDPRFFDLPERIRTESMEKYGRDLTQAVVDALERLYDGKVEEIPELNEKQLVDGKAVLARTLVWINQNLWPVDVKSPHAD